MKNRKYLYKLVTIILVGIFIPVLVALLFFMNRSFKRLNVDNEMYYEKLAISFADSFYLKLTELGRHANSISAGSKETESAFWRGNESFVENEYWYFEAMQELNEKYSIGSTGLFGIYYYETDSVIFPEGKRNSAEFARYLGVKKADDDKWNYFDQANYRKGEVLIGTTNLNGQNDGYMLVGYCTTMGKKFDEVLIFYCIEPNEYKDTIGYVYDSSGVEFYVLGDEDEQLYLAIGEASKSSISLRELNTERRFAGISQRMIYEKDIKNLPISVAMCITDDAQQNDVVAFYRLMWSILWIIIGTMFLVCTLVLYMAYKPVYRLMAEVKEYEGDEFEKITNALHSGRVKILEQEMLIMDLLLKHLIHGGHISRKKIGSLGVDATFQHFCVCVLDGHTLLSNEVKQLTTVIEEKYNARFFVTDWQGEERSILIFFLREADIKEMTAWLMKWCEEHLLVDYRLSIGKLVNELDDIRSSFIDCLNQRKTEENFIDNKQSINEEIISLDYKEDKQKIVLQEILTYIEAHYRDVDIGQTGVADFFKMSSYTLSRMFKKQVGVGFAEYINSKRIEYAKELLLTTTFSVRDVSAMAGFSSDAYFCRVFKAAVGVPPATFREQ